jgi:hypothetical protein
MKKLIISLHLIILAATFLPAQENGNRSYCAASAQNQSELIIYVVMGSIDNWSGWYPYSDFTSMSTLVVPGNSYTLTVLIAYPEVGDIIGVWVDWNGDEIFNEEMVLISGNPWMPPPGTITCPPGTPDGTYRMRIRLQRTGIPEPCGVTDWGEVEDYSLVVLTPPDISLNPLTVNTNIPGYNRTSSENLEIFNTGLGDLTWDASIDCEEAIGNVCLDFNGADQYIHIDQPFPSFSQYTVEFWRYSEGSSTTSWPRMITMLQDDYHSPDYIVIEHNGPDQNTFEITVDADANHYKAFVDVSAYQNQWLHVALTFDGSMTTTYLNGQVAHQSSSGTASFQINKSQIGGCNMPLIGLYRYFNGRLDEIRFWNVARTQQQIQDCMDSTFCEPQAGMMAYWKLDENTGSVITDETGNMADGIIENGAPWYTPGAPLVNDCITPVPAPVIEVTPASGLIPPGGSAQVNLTFHSGDLPFGVYNDCSLIITSNDPDEGDLTVPLSVTVAEPNLVPVADWAVVLGVVLMVGLVAWYSKRS